MFSQIRNRLTLLYLTVMTVFLLSFIVVSYSGIIWVLHREEQQDIQSFADQEARAHISTLRNNLDPALVEDSNDGEKIFSYVFDTTGHIVYSEEPAEKLRPKVLAIMQNWKAADGEGKMQKFYLDNDERAVIMICSMTVYDGQEVLGRVFVGEDITTYYQLLKSLLIVLVIVAILFILAAAVIGHLLAGRAIVPIRQSFMRQREFVADASHELRTPLSILLTSVDVVRTDDNNRLSTFSMQVLDDMKSEVKRMSKLVGDLLTLARADAGVNNIVKERFDLNTVTKQVVRSVQLLADEKGLNLQLSFDNSQSNFIFADRERIGQLLLILIDNALKYTLPGGTVNVRVGYLEGPRNNISIIVEDTGVGISAEHIGSIFNRFYRVDKVRAHEEESSGIGLAIAKWIVDAHGGVIKVKSIPSEGSSFIVHLPV